MHNPFRRKRVNVNQTQRDFIEHVLPFARQASETLGIPTSAILAQWIDETGAGTSQLWLEGHNFAGVSGNADGQEERFGATLWRGGPLLAYPSVEQGLAGYVHRWGNPVYETTRAAWRANDSALAVAQAMEHSPWAAGHYNFRDLETLINELDLTAYDTGGQPNPVPNPSPQPVPGGELPPCGALSPGAPPAGHRLLKVGMHGEDVAQVQEALRFVGVIAVNSFNAAGKPDGIFGPGTAGAVVTFQERMGLHPDGIVGRQTWCAFGVR